jgi:hypothetical protein
MNEERWTKRDLEIQGNPEADFIDGDQYSSRTSPRLSPSDPMIIAVRWD